MKASVPFTTLLLVLLLACLTMSSRALDADGVPDVVADLVDDRLEGHASTQEAGR